MSRYDHARWRHQGLSHPCWSQDRAKGCRCGFSIGPQFRDPRGQRSSKSTLIRLLAGSEAPDRGAITRYARVSFPLGFGGTFHGALSGRENVAFIARIYGAELRGVLEYVEAFSELGQYLHMP